MNSVIQIEIDPSVLAKFPRIRFGLVRGQIEAPRPLQLTDLRARALEDLRGAGVTAENLDQHPHITGWRETYAAFGVKPKKSRPTHEALARRVLRDGVWPEINPIVDVYLTNQMQHLLPHGGYDLAHVSGPIVLALSPGGERFEPLGGGEEVTDAGEVVYRDQRRILTRRWNYRDADATKIDLGTREFLLMIEAAHPAIGDLEIERAVSSLVERYRSAWSGQFEARMFVAEGQVLEI